MTPSSDPLVGRIEALSGKAAGWLDDDSLPPEVTETIRSLIDLTRQLAAVNAAQQEKIAELAATVAVLSTQIANLQRTLYGSRSEKRRANTDDADNSGDFGLDDKPGATDDNDSRRGGKRGRKKKRSDAVNDAGLRYTDKAPVVDVTIMPPQVKGLSEDAYDIISERVRPRRRNNTDLRH